MKVFIETFGRRTSSFLAFSFYFIFNVSPELCLQPDTGGKYIRERNVRVTNKRRRKAITPEVFIPFLAWPNRWLISFQVFQVFSFHVGSTLLLVGRCTGDLRTVWPNFFLSIVSGTYFSFVLLQSPILLLAGIISISSLSSCL